MGKPSAPAPPDYKGAAEAEAKSSKEVTNMQTYANRPDQTTPFGTQTWGQESFIDPATGQEVTKWNQNTTLNPESQRALDAELTLGADKAELAQSMTGRLQEDFKEGMDWSKFGAMGDIVEGKTQNEIDTSGLQGVNDPNAQRGFDQSGLQGVSDPNAQKGFDTGGFQNVDSSERYNQSAGDALYGRATSRLDPQFQQRESDTASRLMNQGLKPGDKAYDREMQNLARDRTDAYQQAGFGADIGAGAEAQRMHGMDLGTRQNQYGEGMGQADLYNRGQGQEFGQESQLRGQQFGEGVQNVDMYNQGQAQEFGQQMDLRGQQYGEEMGKADLYNRAEGQSFAQDMNTSNQQTTQRQQQISEEGQKRGMNLNEMNAIMSGQQVQMPTMPGFNQATKSAATDYSGAARDQFGAEMDIYSQKNAARQATMSGMSNFAGGAMQLSDRRLKKDIKYMGKIFGHKFYSFTYLWGQKSMGVMSDEIPQEYVYRHESGFDMVDYGSLHNGA